MNNVGLDPMMNNIMDILPRPNVISIIIQWIIFMIVAGMNRLFGS